MVENKVSQAFEQRGLRSYHGSQWLGYGCICGAESMTQGKPGAVKDENRLKQMLQAGESVRVIAKVLGKTRDCVRMKIARSNIEVVVQPKISTRTTTSIWKKNMVFSPKKQVLLLSDKELNHFSSSQLTKEEEAHIFPSSSFQLLSQTLQTLTRRTTTHVL